jgi:hypothetical protein
MDLCYCFRAEDQTGNSETIDGRAGGIEIGFDFGGKDCLKEFASLFISDFGVSFVVVFAEGRPKTGLSVWLLFSSF